MNDRSSGRTKPGERIAEDRKAPSERIPAPTPRRTREQAFGRIDECVEG